MNNVNIIGRLVQDVEVRRTNNQKSVSNFRIAVDRSFKDSDGNTVTDYFPIVCWGATADFTEKYFKKGLRVGISGSLQTRSWDDSEGGKHYATEIVAREVYFADGKSDGQGRPSSQSTAKMEKAVKENVSDEDDDLPF